MKLSARQKSLGCCAFALNIILSSMQAGHTQNVSLEHKDQKIKAFHFEHKIDLTKIFKQTQINKKPAPTKINKTTTVNEADLKLIGTLIFGRQKQAWIKVNNQIYRLQTGQTIPGIEVQISQIKPDSVVVNKSTNCDNSQLCNLTITIRESLF